MWPFDKRDKKKIPQNKPAQFVRQHASGNGGDTFTNPLSPLNPANWYSDSRPDHSSCDSSSSHDSGSSNSCDAGGSPAGGD